MRAKDIFTEELWNVILDTIDGVSTEVGRKDKDGHPTSWYIVDSTTAEPDVNWPGDLLGEVTDRESLSATRRQLTIALIGEKLKKARFNQTPFIKSAFERASEVAVQRSEELSKTAYAFREEAKATNDPGLERKAEVMEKASWVVLAVSQDILKVR